MAEQKPLRFILVNVVQPVFNLRAAEYDLGELKSLVDTFGGATIVKIIQRRMRPDPGTYIGKGKTEEVTELIKLQKVDVVVINDVVKASQLHKLEQAFWTVNPDIQVWDKVDLILHIFDKHAVTAEAKLQIELATMRHMGPRMYGLGNTFFSRQAGGIGGRGIGETNIELMKRHWRREMKHVQDKLDKLTANRERQIANRRELGLPTISIVGYTNAGKSSLFNLLTGKKTLVENALFATLDSSVGKLYLPEVKKEVMISDTIGFIQNLPAKLVQAFKSTLMESINADLLLQVIDVSDPLQYEKIAVVEQVIKDLGIDHKPRIYVFNKIDAKPDFDKKTFMDLYRLYNPQFVSVLHNQGIDTLIQAISDHFKAINEQTAQVPQ